MTKPIMLLCQGLSLITALVYVSLILGIVKVGDMSLEEGARVYFSVIPAGYVIGGFLILLRKRWLWIIGAALNAIPIVVFYLAYAGRPDIMLSAPGLISKIAQVLLEVGLIYMIGTAKRS